MTGPPEVSVVIPTRNRWPLLTTHSLPSALCQEDVELEVIVVDDGSEDGTQSNLERVQDSRLRVVPMDTSRGVAAARNAGVEEARGRWIAFLDDDDLWSPRKLRTHVGALGGGDWGYAAAIVVDIETRPMYALPLPDPDLVPAALLRGNVVPGGPSNVMVRTEFLRHVGGFDETLIYHTEDWDLWLRLAAESPPRASNEVLVATLRHPGRSALRGSWRVVSEANRLLAKHGHVTRDQTLAVAEWLALAQHRGGSRLRASGFFLRAAVSYRSPGNLPPAVGALFGEPGMRLASRLLRSLGGTSHVDEEEPPVVVEPAWLDRYRTAAECP